MPKKGQSSWDRDQEKLFDLAGSQFSLNQILSVRDLLLVYVHGGKIMRPKAIKTTLGDLIVTVTDEARPFVDPSNLYAVVSCVLEDLAAHRHLRFYGRPRRKNLRDFD